MMTCKARQHSDQMICHTCGLVWDMNDPEPPECKGEQHRQASHSKLSGDCYARENNQRLTTQQEVS